MGAVGVATREASDEARTVDRESHGGVPVRAQVLQTVLAVPEKGVCEATVRIGPTDNLARVVDAPGRAERATEGTQVCHGAMVVQEGMPRTVGERLGSPDDEPFGADAKGITQMVRDPEWLQILPPVDAIPGEGPGWAATPDDQAGVVDAVGDPKAQVRERVCAQQAALPEHLQVQGRE